MIILKRSLINNTQQSLLSNSSCSYLIKSAAQGCSFYKPVLAITNCSTTSLFMLDKHSLGNIHLSGLSSQLLTLEKLDSFQSFKSLLPYKPTTVKCLNYKGSMIFDTHINLFSCVSISITLNFTNKQKKWQTLVYSHAWSCGVIGI